MAEPEGESLESWLNKATNPSNRQEDWEYIIGFCDQINKELEGPQISVRLLTHKIQSPQEWEAFQALTVLEACMKNCGKRFHNEVAKFRFLNEMIKLVSPKYLGARVSERVKKKVIEMMFCWSIALPDETKITEAYQMLKTQGLVTEDPELPADKTLIPSPTDRPSDSILRNQEKSKRLAELLKSKNPEDLQEANRLIKNMVMEDEARFQRESERSSTLEEANNRVKLLNEMLRHFNATQSSHGDRELLKDLHDDCEKLRTTMFKMASETQDDDAALGKILQASDELSCVINTYKSVVGVEMGGAETPRATPAQSSDKSSMSALLIDLAGLDLYPSASQHSVPTSHSASSDLYTTSSTNPGATPSPEQTSMHRPTSMQKQSSLSFLNEELLSLGFTEPITTATMSQTQQKEVKLLSHNTSPQAQVPLADVLGEHLLFGFPQSVNSSSKSTSQSQSRFIPNYISAATGPAPSVCSGAGGGVSPGLVAASLNDVLIPVESIKPSKESPITVHNKDGVCVVLNFSATWPPSRPDVLVMVLSVLNTAPLTLKNISLHATVPATMALKMQPPSGIELPPYNPLLPPSAIVQVLLLANPHKEKVRMRFRLTYVLGERSCTETGELDQFPPEERWRHPL